MTRIDSVDDSTDGFDGFFRAEHPKLLALGRALAPSVAADLAQESLVRACRNRERVADMDHVDGSPQVARE